MEGTSGAADLDPLRGGSGEAALGSGACAPRKRALRGATRARCSLVDSRGQRARAAGSSEAHRANLASARGGHGGHTAADSPSAAPRSRDMRCPSGSGWGEALVAGVLSGAASGLRVYSRSAHMPDERRRATRVGRPLARETSAGGARRASGSLGSRGRPARRVARPGERERRATSPESGGRRGGWRQTHPEVTPSPAQAGRAVSTSADRGSVDPAVVLVDCSGCRSRREAPGPSQHP